MIVSLLDILLVEKTQLAYRKKREKARKILYSHARGQEIFYGIKFIHSQNIEPYYIAVKTATGVCEVFFALIHGVAI